jgi:hypothetical protein
MDIKRKRKGADQSANKRLKYIEPEDPISEFSSDEEYRQIKKSAYFKGDNSKDPISEFSSDEEYRQIKKSAYFKGDNSKDPISEFSSDEEYRQIKKSPYFRGDNSKDPIVEDSSDAYEEMSPVNIDVYDSLDLDEDIECIPSALKKPLLILNEDHSSDECLSSNEERLSSSGERSSSNDERLASSKEVSPLEEIRQGLSSPDLSRLSNAHRNSKVVSTSMTMFFSKKSTVEELEFCCFSENAARHSLTSNKG